MAETSAAAQRVMARLSEKGWSRATLAREAGVDPATITDFLNGKRWPILATLGKIEAALSLTPGTLAALGEETIPAEPATPERPSELTDADLLAELGYRLTRLQRENTELRQRLQEAVDDALATPATEAELFDFPKPTDPGPVPAWASDVAAESNNPEPKGRAYDNQDEQ